MQISLNFGIKNEIELRSFEIEAIELKIAGEKFCMRVYKKIPKWQQGHRKRFWRDYEKNKIICHVDWDIYPYKLKKVSSKRERELWKSIEMFMNYKGYLDDDYRYPEVVIKAKLGYEYSGDKKEKIECRLSWDGGNNVGEYTCSYGIQMTNNGYFTYDIRK